MDGHLGAVFVLGFGKARLSAARPLCSLKILPRGGACQSHRARWFVAFRYRRLGEMRSCWTATKETPLLRGAVSVIVVPTRIVAYTTDPPAPPLFVQPDHMDHTFASASPPPQRCRDQQIGIVTQRSFVYSPRCRPVRVDSRAPPLNPDGITVDWPGFPGQVALRGLLDWLNMGR